MLLRLRYIESTERRPTDGGDDGVEAAFFLPTVVSPSSLYQQTQSACRYYHFCEQNSWATGGGSINGSSDMCREV
jgi:hypothetical protein